MASDLLAMACNLLAMASNLVAMASFRYLLRLKAKHALSEGYDCEDEKVPKLLRLIAACL